MGLSSMPITHN